MKTKVRWEQIDTQTYQHLTTRFRLPILEKFLTPFLRTGKKYSLIVALLSEMVVVSVHSDTTLGHSTMKAVWNDCTLAESADTVVVDGHHYFKQDSVNMELLRPSSHSSVCSWKGTAKYWDVVVADEVNENAAWCYEKPKEAALHIQGRIAFWKGVKVVD